MTTAQRFCVHPAPRRVAYAAIALLTAACGQPSAPALPLTGEQSALYVLRTVAGGTVPTVALDNGSTTIHLTADSLWLRGDGTGLGVQVARVWSTSDGGPPDAPERWEREFTYTLAGDRIEISLYCPPNALMLCVAPPHYRGVLTATGLRLDQALFYRTPFVYERIGG